MPVTLIHLFNFCLKCRVKGEREEKGEGVERNLGEEEGEAEKIEKSFIPGSLLKWPGQS